MLQNKLLPAKTPVVIFFDEPAEIHYTAIETITEFSIMIDISRTMGWKEGWKFLKHTIEEHGYSIVIHRKYFV